MSEIPTFLEVLRTTLDYVQVNSEHR